MGWFEAHNSNQQQPYISEINIDFSKLNPKKKNSESKTNHQPHTETPLHDSLPHDHLVCARGGASRAIVIHRNRWSLDEL